MAFRHMNDAFSLASIYVYALCIPNRDQTNRSLKSCTNKNLFEELNLDEQDVKRITTPLGYINAFEI